MSFSQKLYYSQPLVFFTLIKYLINRLLFNECIISMDGRKAGIINSYNFKKANLIRLNVGCFRINYF